MAGILCHMRAYDRLGAECGTRPEYAKFRRARAKVYSNIVRKWSGMRAKTKNQADRIAELEAYIAKQDAECEDCEHKERIKELEGEVKHYKDIVPRITALELKELGTNATRVKELEAEVAMLRQGTTTANTENPEV